MLIFWWLTLEFFFILSTCLTILSICELVVDDTVDSKANLEEKTREAEIRMYHLGWNFLQLGRDIQKLPGRGLIINKRLL